MPDTPTDSVMIERTLDAPVDLVWQMWTDPAHFAAWYGPTGSRVPVAEMDVRVGGSRRVCMQMDTPDGQMSMWFTGQFTEVTAPRRLSYTEAMADEDGNVLPDTGDVSHPMTEVIVELEPVGDATRMVLTHVGVPGDSPGAMGWNMALDALADHLAAASGS